MQNIEIKYRIEETEPLQKYLQALPVVSFEFRRQQKDIYFRVPEGRLKIRIETGRPPVLIEYHRPDQDRPRISNYSLTPIQDLAATLAELQDAYGELATVEKERQLFLFRNVRIHLDQVDQLGAFVEFEAVIDDEYNRQASQDNLNIILAKLKPYFRETVPVGYLNLFLEQTNSEGDH